MGKVTGLIFAVELQRLGVLKFLMISFSYLCEMSPTLIVRAFSVELSMSMRCRTFQPLFIFLEMLKIARMIIFFLTFIASAKIRQND